MTARAQPKQLVLLDYPGARCMQLGDGMWYAETHRTHKAPGYVMGPVRTNALHAWTALCAEIKRSKAK